MNKDSKASAAPAPLEILTGLPERAQVQAALGRGAARVIVLTPDPDQARQLTRAFSGEPRLEISAVALAGTAGPATWVRYNEPGLGAFRAPSARLRALLPGLSARRQLSADRMTPADLAARLQGAEGPVVLHLDAPGEEAAILDGLAGSGLADRLQAVILRAGREVLFEGSQPLEALIAALSGDAFRIDAWDGSDPDWPVLRFVPDRVQRDLQDRLAEREAALAETQAALARSQAALAEKAGLEKTLQEVRERAGAAERDLAAEKARVAELERSTATLTAELKKTEGAQEAVARAQKQAEKAREDLAISIRMQTLIRADLDELQTRYTAAETARLAQADLLGKLTPRLENALHRLQGLDADPDGDLALVSDEAEDDGGPERPPSKRRKTSGQGRSK